MTKPNFDTHAFIKTLESGGFTKEQAESQCAAYKDAQSDWDGAIATKADIKETMLYIKGLYVAGVFAFALLGWICLRIVEILEKLPT